LFSSSFHTDSFSEYFCNNAIADSFSVVMLISGADNYHSNNGPLILIITHSL